MIGCVWFSLVIVTMCVNRMLVHYRMTILLDKADKNLRRTTRTSVLFRDEISKTNAKIAQSSKQAELQLSEKNQEIVDLKKYIKELEEKQRVREKEESDRRLEEEKKKSKICVVS
jgi:TolA-binding protein